MAKAIYTVSPGEIEILQKGLSDPDYITGYFFRHPGQDVGWLFDGNFTPEGAWQKAVTMTSQSRITISGGAGCGKSLGIGMGAMSLGMEIPHFKFLNVAEKAWQAQIMYNLILERAEGTLMDEIIVEKPRRPYAKIACAYRIGRRVHRFSLEFMSADRDATGILSWRGDWINIEEAGLFDNLDMIITNVATRLTGNSPLGRPYLARLSLISNPWDTPYFWYLFDMAASDPENSLSMMISTRHNKNVTDKQIREMLKVIPEEDHERFLDGTRPEGKGNYFSKRALQVCEDPYSGEIYKKAAQDGQPGYIWEEMPGVGVYYFARPPERGHVYFVLGDPGSGAAPARNAPCIGVFDATGFPDRPIELAAFWWGNGWGAISPFVNKLLELMGHDDSGRGFPAKLTGIDSTGTQAMLAQLLNIQYFSDDIFDSDTDIFEQKGIVGLDFSGSKKMTYLVTLRLMLEAGKFRWPKAIGGIRSQLANYDPEKDRGPLPKLPQDIVSMMAMAAFAIRMKFDVSLDDLVQGGAKSRAEKVTDGDLAVQRSTDRNQRSDIRAPAGVDEWGSQS